MELVKTNTALIQTNASLSLEKGSKTREFAGLSEKIEILVNALRLVSTDDFIKIQRLIIPDNCEKYGFAEGNHNLGLLLHFLADMLEE